MTERKQQPVEGEAEKENVKMVPTKRVPKKRVLTKKPRIQKKTPDAISPAHKETPSPVVPAVISAIEEVKATAHSGRQQYLEAVGRRKTAIARVRLWKGSTAPSLTINDRPWNKYFPSESLQIVASSPLKAVGQWEKLAITCMVSGGGTQGQAEAVRHGIARVLLKLNPVFRKALKKSGYLTRDPREVERKKFGLKGARRAPQWGKR